MDLSKLKKAELIEIMENMGGLETKAPTFEECVKGAKDAAKNVRTKRLLDRAIKFETK